MDIVDPLNNPTTVPLSAIAVGDAFTQYDVDAGKQLHYLKLNATATGNVYRFDGTPGVVNLAPTAQVVARAASLHFD